MGTLLKKALQAYEKFKNNLGLKKICLLLTDEEFKNAYNNNNWRMHTKIKEQLMVT